MFKERREIQLIQKKYSLHWVCLRGTPTFPTRDLNFSKEPQKVSSVIEKDVGRGGWEEERI